MDKEHHHHHRMFHLFQCKSFLSPKYHFLLPFLNSSSHWQTVVAYKQRHFVGGIVLFYALGHLRLCILGHLHLCILGHLHLCILGHLHLCILCHLHLCILGHLH